MVARGDGTFLLYAGYNGESYLDDLWELDLGTGRWRSLDLDPPAARRGDHAMIWEPVRGLLATFGGSVHSDGVDLQLIDVERGAVTASGPLPGPVVRTDHTLVLDSRSRAMVLFGGTPPDWTRTLNDTWMLVLP